MDEIETDSAAVLDAIRAETEAWLQRDFEAWSSHWVQSPRSRRMEAWVSLGVRVDEGWEAIAARIKKIVARFPEKSVFEGSVRREHVNIVIDGNVAWATFDQIGSDTGTDRKRQLRILHRIDGTWKIACAVVMECAIEEASEPLIEVDQDVGIVWMNRSAQERISNHPGLLATAGHLRTRRRGHSAVLREAVHLAHTELQSQRPLNVVAKQSWPVVLGEDESGARLYCWVLLEDGRVLASFDDEETKASRIESAREIFGLSPAQSRLARLLIDGHELAAAADILHVSINTLRTQLQRIFDKTGVRNQGALIRTLLRAHAPTR